MDANAYSWAAASIMIMVGVIVAMDWVATPLNRNIQTIRSGDRLPGSLIHSTLGLLFALANIFAVKWGIFVGALWFSVILLAAISNWWIAYFVGVYWGEINPEVYTQHYARNITVLPRFKNHPVIPDVQHMLIHLTVLAATLLTWNSWLRT